jgi:hypothetical protein
MPLFRAATAVLVADPDAFPIRHYVRLTIASSKPLPDIWPEHGYDVPTAMIEVLVDAGMHADERLVEREQVRPGMSGYSVYIEESRFGDHSIGPSSPPSRAD